MAVKKKVVEIDTKDAQQQVDNLKESMAGLNKENNAATTSVKELRQELKAQKDAMLSAEEGTKEYNDALQKAANIQLTLKDQMEEVNASAMDFGQIAGNVVKATGGVVAGFQAAKATLNLFGIENEAVLQSLEKMQNLMAITQAIPALDDGVKAFKRLGLAIKAAAASMSGLKAALVSTGIGALVVAVGLLAANWDKVTDAMRKWGIISEDTEEKIKKQQKALEDWTISLNKARGELYNQETTEKISKMNEKAKESYDELTKSITNLELQQKVVEAERQIEWRKNGDRTERAIELTEQFNNLTDQIHKLHQAQKAILEDENSYKELPKTISKAVDESKRKISELELILWETIQKLSPVSLQNELLAKFGGSGIVIPVKLEIDETEEEDTSFEDAFRQKIQGTVDGLRKAFGISEEEQYQQEINALEVALNTKLIKEEEYLKLRDALNKEQTERELQRYSIAASGIGQIFTNLGEFMEEGSKEQKAVQIMGATINMLGGITAAIAGAFTTHTGPWDIALAAIQATAIATNGAATIAKMAKTNKSNASSISASPNASAVSSIQAPIQYTQDVQGSSIENAIKDTRVYVVESDISNTQNRVDVTESEARF